MAAARRNCISPGHPSLAALGGVETPGARAGLGKTVAYVRFISRTELVASTVNSSLSLWSWEPMERHRTFTGHVNVRNFVGMETSGDYIACGSETSQVCPPPLTQGLLVN